MNDLHRETYRGLVRKECDEMRLAAAIWKRTDITREEKLKLFSEAQARILEYEADAKAYFDSFINRPK